MHLFSNLFHGSARMPFSNNGGLARTYKSNNCQRLGTITVNFTVEMHTVKQSSLVKHIDGHVDKAMRSVKGSATRNAVTVNRRINCRIHDLHTDESINAPTLSGVRWALVVSETVTIAVTVSPCR